MTKCIDCKTEIYKDSIRCRSCDTRRKIKLGILSKIGRKFSAKTKKIMSLLRQGTNHPCYKDGRTLKQYYCKECKIEISITSGIYGSGYCRKCTEKGERGHNYKDGKGNFPYSPEFNDQLKEHIRKRDNYECQNCSMIEEEHLIVYGRVLEIHHIDYNKQNCQENNLITLCKQCNVRANANRDYWKNKYFLILETKNANR